MVAGGGYTTKRLSAAARCCGCPTSPATPAPTCCSTTPTEPWERLNVADTVKVPWQAYLGAGHPLLSDQGRVLATIVADDVGRHDALCGTSTARQRGPLRRRRPQGPSGGRELLILAAAKHGLEPRDLPPSVSFFQGVRVQADGALTFTGSAGAGRAVSLRAELPLIVLIANVAAPARPA